MGHIAIIGSCSTDFTIVTKQIANQGETVLGESLHTAFGGKGANQAVAAARLGASVRMIGCVGDDMFAEQILTNFKDNHVNTTHMRQVDGASGTAHITLYEGDNRIIVIPSANKHVGFDTDDALAEVLDDVELVILQHEIPLETNTQVISYCAQHDIDVILNPAPAAKIASELIEQVTYLTPNENEFAALFPDEDQEMVLARYPNKLIITLGDQGAIFHDGTSIQQVPCFETKVVDTTGAGDTFNGAFAYARLNGYDMHSAITFANLASSLSIQKIGAQGGIPTLEEMKQAPHFDNIATS